MKETKISREVTQLQEDFDTFLFFDRVKKDFTYPLHYHPEYEINFIRNASGVSRIVGDSIETIDDYELCLVGPNLYHVWENGLVDPDTDKREITIQFVNNIFSDAQLKKDIFKPISRMLRNSVRGIKFSRQTAIEVEPMLIEIGKRKGFESFLQFLRVLNKLATSTGQRMLSTSTFPVASLNKQDDRIDLIHDFLAHNYSRRLMVKDAAAEFSMSPMSFTRFIKQYTGKSFIMLLNEIRLGYATRMMIDSDRSISEICFSCGFNNISNFNRIFKKKQGLTPSEFRRVFHGTKTIY